MEEKKALRILYVEDSPHDAELVRREIKRFFPQSAFKVVDTKESLMQSLRNFQPELVLSDYSMPAFNGLEVLEIVFEQQAEIPVIIVTGSIDEETAVGCLRAGATDYVLKESLNRLGQSISQALRQKELNAERLRVLELLQESEERFRRLAENAQDMNYRFELSPQRKCTYMSSASLKITGYAPEEYYADPDLVFKYVHPDDYHLLEKMIQNENSVRQSLTLRYIRKDGQLIWKEQRNIPVFDEKGQLVALEGIARDVTRQKQAEEKMLLSDRVFNFTVDMFCIAGFDGFLKVLNPAWERTLGWTREELMDRPFMEFVYPEDYNETVSVRDKIVAGEKVVRFDNRYVCKDGTVKWLSWSAHPVFEEKIMIAACRDVTEYKQTLNALRESEEKFRTLFYNHAAAKMMIDSENGNIVEVNQAAAALYGWSESQFATMTIADLDPLPDPVFTPWLQRMLASTYANKELKHRKANGTIFDVEIFSSKVSIGGKDFLHWIVHDISDKKEAMRGLRLLNRAVEQSPVGMVITDIDGRIEYVNPTFSRVSGYRLDEVVGQIPRILKSGQHPDQLYKELWDMILSGKDWSGELLNKKKDGSLYWVDAIISPIFSSAGEMTHFVTVQEDITEKKNLIKDLVKAKEKAEESDRLKSAFLANMSHEIRTPMNGIIGFLELLQETDLDSEVREEYLQVVRSSSDRLMSTLNDIIEISKVEAGYVDLKESVFEVSKILSYLYDFFRPDAHKRGLRISMVNHLTGQTFIKTDKRKLETILGNLIKNALKFTARGFIEIGVYEEQEELVFFVRDSGSGIAADQYEVIFDRFTQAQQNLTRAYEGSGLGLSICRAYGDILGGRVWLESEMGKGSTFYVSLPAEIQLNGKEHSWQQLVKPRRNKDEDDTLIRVTEDDEPS